MLLPTMLLMMYLRILMVEVLRLITVMTVLVILHLFKDLLEVVQQPFLETVLDKYNRLPILRVLPLNLVLMPMA